MKHLILFFSLLLLISIETSAAAPSGGTNAMKEQGAELATSKAGGGKLGNDPTAAVCTSDTGTSTCDCGSRGCWANEKNCGCRNQIKSIGQQAKSASKQVRSSGKKLIAAPVGKSATCSSTDGETSCNCAGYCEAGATTCRCGVKQADLSDPIPKS